MFHLCMMFLHQWKHKNGLVVEIESRRQWRSVFDSMKVSNKLLYGMFLQNVAGTYRANTLPAFVFLKRGEEIDRVVGAKPDELVYKIEKHRV
ncbi:unnamed protein product [Brassica napus]|uniref:(rape) hypothetical protein n=1 Tax=Brassica napus TaxID=3708 RepID=A0A816WA51_BRANA|nr:unnamed protein product [Brassica napus]